MFLAFKLSNLITVPFGWLMGWLYQVTDNYGIAMILFAVCVQMALLPITAKSKKSMMKMSRIQPQMQEIQRRYADDQQKQSEAIQKLQQEEGVSMTGSCLWSFIPMFILIPLFTVIREPLTYILGCGAEMSTQIVDLLKGLAPDAFGSNAYYAQVTAAQLIPSTPPRSRLLCLLWRTPFCTASTSASWASTWAASPPSPSGSGRPSTGPTLVCS